MSSDCIATVAGALYVTADATKPALLPGGL